MHAWGPILVVRGVNLIVNDLFLLDFSQFLQCKKYIYQTAITENVTGAVFPQRPAVKALWQNTETNTTFNLLFLVVVMTAPPLTAQGLLMSSLGSFPVCRSLEPSSWELRPGWKKLNMPFYFSTIIMTGATVWGNKTTCDLEFFDFSPSWCYSAATIVPFW